MGLTEIRRPSSATSVGPGNTNGLQPTLNATLRPRSRLVDMQNASDQPQPQPERPLVQPAAWSGSAASTARRSVYNPSSFRVPAETEHITNNIGQFNLGLDPKAPVFRSFNPSEGPSRSLAPSHRASQSVALSQTSASSTRPVPVKNDIYVNSGHRRKDFRQGEVISLPFHVSNTNPNVDPHDQRLTKTCLGGAYSKRRMMVILWIFQESMFCLPLYSFSDRGISAKADHVRREYVCVKNVGDRGFVNDGPYEPLEVRNRLKPISTTTTVQLTGGTPVTFSEDIARVGRLTEDSYERLVEIWQGVNEDAQKQPWVS